MPNHNLYNLSDYFQSLAKGDASAFEIIFEFYRKRVFAVAFKMLKSDTDAEEIVQDVFLSIWLAKGRLIDIHDPEAYLFTITYNAIYTHLKKVSSKKKLLHSLIRNLTEIQNTTEEAIAANETQKLINDAIQLLPRQQRIVYELCKHEGLSYDEIAERMHISRNTVRNHLVEAMKAIRTFLKKKSSFFISVAIFFLHIKFFVLN